MDDSGKIECPKCLGRIPKPEEWFDERGNWRASDRAITCPRCEQKWALKIVSGKHGNMPIMEEVGRLA